MRPLGVRPVQSKTSSDRYCPSVVTARPLCAPFRRGTPAHGVSVRVSFPDAAAVPIGVRARCQEVRVEFLSRNGELSHEAKLYSAPEIPPFHELEGARAAAPPAGPFAGDRTAGSALPAGRRLPLDHRLRQQPRQPDVGPVRHRPPPGFARWTLRLLEEKVVELQIVSRASDSTIGRVLKKTSSSPIRGSVG